MSKKDEYPVEEVWGYYCAERLSVMKSLGAGGRPLKLTDKIRKMIEKLFCEGYDYDDFIHVIMTYSSDARRNRTVKWMNSTTPWRPLNFAQQHSSAVDGHCSGMVSAPSYDADEDMQGDIKRSSF